MGRLENFIPHMKAFKLISGGGVNVMQFKQGDSVIVDDQVAPFMRQVNGHLSLREICLFLNRKREVFSIEKSIAMLTHLASADLMTNASDYVQILEGKGPKKANYPKATQLDRSYFSDERLVALIQKTTLFLKCDRSVAEELLKSSSLERFEPEHLLIEKGSRSTDFYVLLSGEVGVFRENECLATLGSLSVFGESAAIFDQPRNADVKVTAPSWILKINAANVVDTSAPESFESYKGLKSRLILNQTLASNPLFKSIPTDVLQFFISKCRIEKYGKEQTVVEQDSEGDDFYFILQGSVSIIKDGMPITSLQEGDHFGEMAAIFREPRSASVITEASCSFLVMSQTAFFEVLSSHFSLAIDIERIALERKQAKGNIMQIFDEDSDAQLDDHTAFIDINNLRDSINIDEDFLETSHTNFDMELHDFSQGFSLDDADEEAS